MFNQFETKLNYVVIAAAIVAIAVLFTWRAKAQTVPAPAAVERSFTVTLPLSKWQKIADTLSKEPFKEVAPIITEMQQQISAQDAKQNEEKPK